MPQSKNLERDDVHLDIITLLSAAPPTDYAASAAMCALTILSGFCTGSPRLILSTFSMPELTLPQTVYWPLRNDASSKQMKNWLSPELGSLARAIEVVPRTCGSLLNSALSFWPEPPVPVPCGQPVCARATWSGLRRTRSIGMAQPPR